MTEKRSPRRYRVTVPAAAVAAAAAAFFPCSQARAEVGDPTIETNHPHYPGEGAFQTPEDIVKRVTAGKKTAQERAIALWKWTLTHQYHAQQPMEWSRGNKVPDSRNQKDNLMYLYDSERARFSYGYAMCGTAHAWNQVLWKAAGFNAYNRAYPGHTNSEIIYDGGRHTFDTDMAGLLFRDDGVVAGYEDVAKNPKIFDNDTGNLPQYPFPGGRAYMKKSWARVAARLRKNPKAWWKLYNVAYAGMPGVVRLRAGETFTRWFNPDHYGGREKRLYWNNTPGGPFREWTYVNIPPVNKKKSPRGKASYGNAEFVYKPNLARETYKEGVCAEKNTAFGPAPAGKPRLHAAGKGNAFVVFEHLSPYVIAARAKQGGLPQTTPAEGGLVLSGEAAGGPVTVSVSNNGGISWKKQGTVEGKFTLDATDRVKGRWGWLVKFSFTGTAGLRTVRFTTICQMSQSIYPRLKPGGCRVTYRVANRGLTRLVPYFFADEKKALRHEVRTLREGKLKWLGAKPDQRIAFQFPGKGTAALVYRLRGRGSLVGFAGAFNYTVKDEPHTPPELAHSLSVSTDGGKTWKEVARAKPDLDNEFSSGWLYGKTTLPEGTGPEILCRIGLNCGPWPTGLCRVELYGLYRTAPAPKTTVEYGWREDGELKRHVESVPSGVREKVFVVPTGRKIQDDFIRIAVP